MVNEPLIKLRQGRLRPQEQGLSVHMQARTFPKLMIRSPCGRIALPARRSPTACESSRAQACRYRSEAPLRRLQRDVLPNGPERQLRRVREGRARRLIMDGVVRVEPLHT